MSKTVIRALLMCSVAVLLPPQQANATLMTFKAKLRGSDWTGNDSTFWADTGLTRAPIVNWVGRVTVDTAVAPVRALYDEPYFEYEFDQPGTSMSIIVGDLTLTWNRFSLILNDDSGSGCDFLYVRPEGRPSGPVSSVGFNQIAAFTCRREGRLADYSLEGLMDGLRLFGGSRYESAITANRWQVLATPGEYTKSLNHKCSRFWC